MAWQLQNDGSPWDDFSTWRLYSQRQRSRLYRGVSLVAAVRRYVESGGDPLHIVERVAAFLGRDRRSHLQGASLTRR